MTAPRSTRVIEALIEAKGKWCNSEALAIQLGMGRPQVSAAISEARAQGVTIETHKFRGVGWRIAPASETPVVVTMPPPASDDDIQRLHHALANIGCDAPQPAVTMTAPDMAELGEALVEATLSRRAARMRARLWQAQGAYVDGRTLADAMLVEMTQLSVYAAELRRKCPDLRLEGLRGRGYRIATLADEAAPPAAPLHPHTARRTAIELLDQLLPATAEKLRTVALEAGETFSETLFRVIEYGIEVHHCLVQEGQHPLQLGRQTAAPAARRAA